MAELKPCPFCGGVGKVFEKTECYGYGDYAVETCVACTSCGARGKTISDHDVGNPIKRGRTACEAWNRRTDNESR